MRAAIVAAMVVSSVGLSLASDVQAAIRKSTHIPAQGLGPALQTLAKDRDFQIVYRPEFVRGLSTTGISGELTPEEALTQLLQGTGLTHRKVDDKTITIVPAAERIQLPSTGMLPEQMSVMPLSVGDDQPAVQPTTVWQRLRLAQAEFSATAKQNASSAKSDAGEARYSEVEELVVTGSRLATPRQQPVPVKILSRAEIDSSGATSVAQALNQMPEVSVQSTTAPFQASRASSTVQLRGLPSGTALVLLNGRRLAGTPFQASSGITNLNVLPLSAVERIELLPSGSSAIYGGDALAGVVNIILKKDFDGAEVNARYGSADSYDEKQTSFTIGKSFSRGSFSFMGSYVTNSVLWGSDRAITANTDYSRYGGHVYSVTYGMPGNVFTRDGSNLPGLNSRYAAIPVGTDGIGLTVADFAATAGTLQRDTGFYRYSSVIPASETASGLLYGTFDLTPNIELFGEALYSRYQSEEMDYPIFIHQAYRVPASNAFNPFGVDLGVDHVFRTKERFCYCLKQEYSRAALGARGNVGAWRWEVAGTYTRGKDTTNEGPVFDPNADARITTALASSDPATALNVFSDRFWTLAELEPYGLMTLVNELTSELSSVTGFISGPLFDFGAGAVEASFGVEAERSDLYYNYYITTFSGDRDNYALFSEVRVPLIGPGEGGNDARVALTGAVRFDDYSDFGSEFSTQFGIEVRPHESWLLRAAYSEAYKPPRLYQLFSPAVSTQSTLTDSRRGNEAYAATYLTGGNPDLDAMTGYSTSAGFVFTPASVPGFQFLATHWTTKIENYSTLLSTNVVIANEELFPGYVIRAQPTAQDIANGYPGRIQEFRNIYLNFGTFDLAGVDTGASWRLRTRFGEFVPAVSGSYTYKYDTALIPGVPVADRAGKATASFFAPNWKATASLGWNTSALQTTLAARYVGEYEDYAPSKRKLGDFTVFDFNAKLQLGKALGWTGSVLEQSYVTLGAVNLFNRLPDYSYNRGTVGYDPTQYDIRGRFIYLQAGLKL
ncbi:TonB-dependent receptor [Steroidobacter sp.]|uniref:TonB-dependent receptor n=1 Tax=Steroidobacter sp. TaxID=1978227 RepID=UPI001A386600|nr:TonB-dependent receptor [Steroidobacter sp.]MBL8271689.1 TonB-dependent receptor [Steroidobacter sp.]